MPSKLLRRVEICDVNSVVKAGMESSVKVDSKDELEDTSARRDDKVEFKDGIAVARVVSVEEIKSRAA